MIKSKQELRLFCEADMMMNRGYFRPSFKRKLASIIQPDYIMKYLNALRKTEYYSSHSKILYYFFRWRLSCYSVKLNISIEPGVFEYGLVIPHYGTIVVGGENKIGKYAVLHTSTCITRGGKHIGDALYLSSGAKIVNDVELGNGITISANSLVNKSEIGSNMLLAGCPAVKKKEMIPWYVRDGKEFERRVSEVEALKQSLK